VTKKKGIQFKKGENHATPMSKTGSNFEQQALNLAPGEEVLFQFDVAYQKKPGTLALTSQKLIYYDKPSSASSPLYILRSHFVGKKSKILSCKNVFNVKKIKKTIS